MSRRILLGHDRHGKEQYLSTEVRSRTHMHVVGGSGTGKSRFLESIIRQDIEAGQGLCVIDWHGSLYRSLVDWCSYHNVGWQDGFRRIVLLNPSRPENITGFNPFMRRGDGDPSTQVARCISATLTPWGQSDSDGMPTFERVARIVYTFAVEVNIPLPIAAQLLDFRNRDLREYALTKLPPGRTRQQLQNLQAIRAEKEWTQQVISLDNRLSRFLGSASVRRFMGLSDGNLDLLSAMETGSIVLVNLAQSPYLAPDEAQVFASLLLADFFHSTMQRVELQPRGSAPAPYVLYLDEFQQYITDDIAAMLDQVRKGGLHLVLAHQHFGHLIDRPELRKSILADARIRVAFGGLDHEDATLVANEMFLSELNERQVNSELYRTVHDYVEEVRVHHSSTHGTATGETRTDSSGTSSSHSTGRVASDGQSTGLSLGETSTSSHTLPENSSIPSTTSAESGTTGSTSTHSHAEAESESTGFSESESRTISHSTARSSSKGSVVVPFLKPVPRLELGSEGTWTLEEKRNRIAERVKNHPQRHFFVKADTESPVSLETPAVEPPPMTDALVSDYVAAIYALQGARPAAAIDEHLRQNEQHFFAVVRSERQQIAAENAVDTIGRS